LRDNHAKLPNKEINVHITKKNANQLSTIALTAGVFASDLSKNKQLARDIYKEAVADRNMQVDQPGSTIGIS